MPVVPVTFVGFAPDMDPATPGVFAESNNIYPTPRGFRVMPGLEKVYDPPGGGPVYGLFVGEYLDNSTKLIAGTRTKLYQAVGAGWTDVSGSTYATDPEELWRFAMFGDDMIAVNDSNQPQVMPRTGSTFVDLAGRPPVARYVETVNNFVFLSNLREHETEVVDGVTWWCSGIGNDTEWDPDIATQAANGRLLDTEGEITGMKRLGRNLVIYKKKSMYLFEYTGPPTIWSIRLLSGQVGAISNEGIIDMGDRHIFLGYDDFYVFDGAGPPRPLQSPLRRFMFELGDLNRLFASTGVKGRWDRSLSVLVWHYPSPEIRTASSPQQCDKWVMWSPGANHWTHGQLLMTVPIYPEAVQQAGLTYGGIPVEYASYLDVNVRYNSYIFAGSTDVLQGVVGPDGGIYLYSGQPAGDAYIKTGDMGDGQNYYFVRRLRPKFAAFPPAVGLTVEGYAREVLGQGDAQVVTGFLDQVSGWVNLIQNARYHGWKFLMLGGDSEIMGFDADQDVFGYR
jgi:hypothetical protein